MAHQVLEEPFLSLLYSTHEVLEAACDLYSQLVEPHLLHSSTVKFGRIDESRVDHRPSRAQLWYDVREFAEIRRCMKSDVFPSRVRIILEGDFPFSDEDLDVQHHIRQIADVVEISGL